MWITEVSTLKPNSAGMPAGAARLKIGASTNSGPVGPTTSTSAIPTWVSVGHDPSDPEAGVSIAAWLQVGTAIGLPDEPRRQSERRVPQVARRHDVAV